MRQTLNRGKAAAAAAAPGAAPAAPGAAPAAPPGAAPAKRPAAAAQDYALGNDYAGTLRWVGMMMRSSCQNSTNVQCCTHSEYAQ